MLRRHEMSVNDRIYGPYLSFYFLEEKEKKDAGKLSWVITYKF